MCMSCSTERAAQGSVLLPYTVPGLWLKFEVDPLLGAEPFPGWIAPSRRGTRRRGKPDREQGHDRDQRAPPRYGGIARAHPGKHRAAESSERESECEADRDSDSSEHQAVAHDQGDHLAPPRTESHAHRDLVRAAGTHRIRDQPVDTDQRDRDRDRGVEPGASAERRGSPTGRDRPHAVIVSTSSTRTPAIDLVSQRVPHRVDHTRGLRLGMHHDEEAGGGRGPQGR